MKRCGIVLLCLILCLVCPLHAAAATFALLQPKTTHISSGTGECEYNEKGILTFRTDEVNGATAVVDLALQINVHQSPYVQLSVQSSSPFNVALKLSSGEYAVFPQLAGPSWYEAFQDNTPASGEGIASGSYTLSLDMQAYMRYNDLEIPQDGNVTVQAVYIMLKKAGSITVEHFKLSDAAEFKTVSGKNGKAAFAPQAITTAPKGEITTTTTHPTYDAGGVTRYQTEGLPSGVIVIMVSAVVLVAAMVLMNLLKKRKHR